MGVFGTLAVGGGIAPDIVRVDVDGKVTMEVGDKAQMAESVHISTPTMNW